LGEFWRKDLEVLYIRIQVTCLLSLDLMKLICMLRAEGARQLWFKRNKVVHGGDFAHPNDLILIAKNHIADYKAAMQPVTLVHDAEVTSDGAEEILLKVTST
jgi:hypothetical protein